MKNLTEKMKNCQWITDFECAKKLKKLYGKRVCKVIKKKIGGGRFHILYYKQWNHSFITTQYVKSKKSFVIRSFLKCPKKWRI